jgi:glutamate carboxypeptidase
MVSPLNLAAFRQEQPAIQSLLAELVNIESPTTEKDAVDRLGKRICELCGQAGAETSLIPAETAGDALLTRWGCGEGGFLVLCHMDTVFDLGTLAARPFTERDGKLWGPGVLDMKAGIAILISVMRWMQAQGTRPCRPLSVLFTADEETGSASSQRTIEELAGKAGLVLCLEPGLVNGALKTERKGIGEIKLRTKGVAAHAGSDHEKGRNAIEELAYHVLAAQKLTDYRRGTTVNVGLIGWGTRTNVVPEEAWADVDFRVTSLDEVDRLQRWVDGIASQITGTSVSARLSLDRPPMPHDALMVQTYARAKRLGEELGLQVGEGSTGGGSDANFVAPLGVPVLDGLGGVGEGAHSEREYVVKDSLAERAALLAALLLRWD